jgi:hypothetical protein
MASSNSKIPNIFFPLASLTSLKIKEAPFLLNNPISDSGELLS